MDRTRIVRQQINWLLTMAVACVAVFTPSQAAAHLVTTGMGTIYDGIGHLLLTPEDILPAVAVALYAGLRGKDISRLTMFLFPLAWFLGGVVGMMVIGTSSPPIQVVSLAVVGGLVAADAKLPKAAILILLSMVGGIHGFFNGVAMVNGPGLSGMFGIASMLFVLVAIVAAVVSTLRLTWTRVAVRVAGSWIAAVGILMLGWMAKGVS